MHHTHFGCYAIIVHGSRVALIRKARGPYTGRFDLPGGTPDFGECPKETVVREVREELGIIAMRPVLLYADSVLFDYTNAGEPSQLHHIGLIYQCTADSHALDESGDGLDSDGGLWASADDVDLDSLTPFARHAIHHLDRA